MSSRIKLYLDNAERAASRVVGRDRAKSIRVELEAHLLESIAEGQELGLDLEQATLRSLQKLGEFDPSPYAGMIGLLPYRRNWIRFAAWLTGAVLLVWPWAGWLWINSISTWAIPATLFIVVVSFFALKVVGTKNFLRPVLLAGIAVTLLNGFAMPLLFVQVGAGVPMLRERAEARKTVFQQHSFSGALRRNHQSLVAMHEFYTSPGATEAAARGFATWEKDPFMYPQALREARGVPIYELTRTSDFELAKAQWRQHGPEFLREQLNTVSGQNAWLTANEASLNQPYMVTVQSTMLSTLYFFAGYLFLVGVGVALGSLATLTIKLLKTVTGRVTP